MKKFRVLINLIMILGILLIIVNIQPAQAMPITPSEFQGTVTVNTVPVTSGTVEARINGVQYATATWSSNLYIMSVGSDDSDTPYPVVEGGVAGDTVEFYVNDIKADQEGVWTSGSIQEGFNLTVTTTGVNPVPIITNLSQSSVIAPVAPFILTVNGLNFIETSVVRWKSSLLPPVDLTTTYVSETQLTASITAAQIKAGYTYVTVYNEAPGGGTSNPELFTIYNAVPTITSLSPSSALAGGLGFTLTVNGTGFVSGTTAQKSTVLWNGVERTTTYVAGPPVRLTISVTAGDIAAAGIVPITVINRAPGGGLSNVQTFTITGGNQTPVCSAVALTVAEDTAGDVAPACTDANGDTLSYSIVAQGTSGTASVVGNMLHFIPAANVNGSVTFTYRAYDGTAYSNTANAVVTITSVNDLPTISDITDKTTNEDTATGSIPFTVGDVETAVGSLTVTATSSNTTLVPNANITLGGTSASRTINIMPASNQFGTTTITVTVNDGTGGTASDTFVLTVTAVNDAPVCSAVALTVAMNTPGDVAPACTDVDGDTLSYSIVAQGTSGTVSVVGNMLHFIPATDVSGSVTFTYRAYDGAAFSNTANAVVTITAPNHTVTFNANGGTGSMSPQTTNVPTALTANAFTRTGYTFSNWNTLANGTGVTYSNGVVYSFAADLTLYAQWTVVNHTVTFNANGGTGSMSPQIANVPTALTLNTFTRSGYNFAGWNTAANGSGTAYADGATYSFAADITLYAQWTVLPKHTIYLPIILR